jgi:deoxyribodipyrimidine photo-lyase
MKTSSPLLRPAASAPRTPASRLRDLNDAPIREDGRFVVYWMTAFRRLSHNFALQRAVEWAEELGQGLVLLEPLRAAYPWASERFHAFVIEGMQEHARELAEGGEGRSALRYYPYLEPKAGEGQGLLRALSQHASVVIADDWPCFHQPSMLAAAAKQLSCRLEAVDASCITPLAELEKTYQRAFSLRKLLHRQAPDWLQASPTEDPLAGLEGLPQPRLPREITQRWPAARLGRALSAILEEIDLPEGPGRVESLRGGSEPARERLEAWVRSGLRLYGAGRNHPDEDAASGLSPWLHFGMISPHEVLERVAVFARRSGLEEVVAGAEGFADELITWRELGHQYCPARTGLCVVHVLTRMDPAHSRAPRRGSSPAALHPRRTRQRAYG